MESIKGMGLACALLAAGALAACGPAPAKLDAAPTEFAIQDAAPQTAQAPEPTEVPTLPPQPTSTPRPASTLPSLRPTASPTPSPETEVSPEPTHPMETQHFWLVSVKELTDMSESLGIAFWEIEEDIFGEAQTCRTFLGQSWSDSPNQAINCVWRVAPGVNFDQALAWLSDVGVISATARSLDTSYEYQGDFILYADEASNGHAVYDGFLLDGGFLYWASVSIGLQLGETPESIFLDSEGALDTFIRDVLLVNLEKSHLPQE